LTPRERWHAAISGKQPDLVPCDYSATGEVTARLMAELGCGTERDLWERLGIDKSIPVVPKHPLATEDTWHMQSLFSIWHVETAKVTYGEGLGVYEEAVTHPLAAAETTTDIEQFPWPDPEMWDFSQISTECGKWESYPIVGGCYEPFYLYCHLRGMERAFADLLLCPSMAEAGLERIFWIHESVIRRTLEPAGGRIDLIHVAEDLGTQESLLMSPQCFRRFLKPHMARMIEMVHSFGAKVIHHDDGAIRPMLPELIEIGIDILNPVQWRCHGMDREGLVRDFGQSLTFHGAVDNQQTLPFGTPEDVRREVLENIRIFRAARGYVVAPCHNIQPNTPTENIVAMYETVQESDPAG